MTKQSPFETSRFIDTDFGSWYTQGLPAHITAQFNNAGHTPHTLNDFDSEIPHFELSLTEALKTCHEPHNAYHGLSHAQRATENAWDGYDGLRQYAGLHVPLGFLQAVLLGTALHDKGHPGTTFFADAAPCRIPLGASTDMAVERYSAEQSSLYVAACGGTPKQQLVAAYIPASSAYGADEEHGQRLAISRATNPVGISGRMMRAVDVLPADGDFTIGAMEDTAVLYGETMPGGKQPPTTVEAYCRNRIGFLSEYVLPTFDKLDEAAGVDLTASLGWRTRVHRRLEQTDALRNRRAPVLQAILRSSIEARYGKQLEEPRQ